MFSTDFIFRQQENLFDNQKCQARFRPLFNKILMLFFLKITDLMVEMNEKNIDDIDFSKYWSDYDTWGYDKRSLGSMKRKKAGQPFNEMKKKSDTWAYDKRAIG